MPLKVKWQRTTVNFPKCFVIESYSFMKLHDKWELILSWCYYVGREGWLSERFSLQYNHTREAVDEGVRLLI